MTGLSDPTGAFGGRFLTAPEDVAPFLTDWRKLWSGRALGVALPETPQDVAALVRWCAAANVPVVPQGGNTGMSGGATPSLDGRSIVLSTARLNRIRAVDTINDTITVDAGVVLATVQEAAREAGRLFPLSLGAEGSCTLGGNLATNAGGAAVLRYGNARELCLGLEVVTAQGEIWDGLRGLRKDNSGYDLRDLFIGSEGTLGIITGAVMRLHPAPVARHTAFVAFRRLDEALRALERLRAAFPSQLTSFEILSETCLWLVEQHLPNARSPLDMRAPWYGLIELSAQASDAALGERFEAALAALFEDETLLDAALAGSHAQRLSMWALREGVAEAQSAVGKTIKHDIAVPIPAVPAFVHEAQTAIIARWPDLLFVTFGHLGDGNLHYNFSPAPGADQDAFMAQQDEINRLVHDLVAARGGTISAEHGLGVLRRDEVERLKSPVEMAMMRAIKTALDPQGLLNPGKVLA